MEIEKTSRGFRISKFKDEYGVECTIQESSIIEEEGHIWFGPAALNLKKLQNGWHDVQFPLPGDTADTKYSAHTRMHLSQSQVKELLPLLTHFAEHGYLPEPPAEPEKKLIEDERVFGAEKWVYCKSHVGPHMTGWCTVPASQKTLLEATTQQEAYAECRDAGLKLFRDDYRS